MLTGSDIKLSGDIEEIVHHLEVIERRVTAFGDDVILYNTSLYSANRLANEVQADIKGHAKIIRGYIKELSGDTTAVHDIKLLVRNRLAGAKSSIKSILDNLQK